VHQTKMARKPTPRPVGEHLTTLTRMVQQIDLDSRLGARVKSAVKRHLTEALTLLQREMLRSS
jgi:hypothetical protein